jgi:hypothetical protein
MNGGKQNSQFLDSFQPVAILNAKWGCLLSDEHSTAQWVRTEVLRAVNITCRSSGIWRRLAERHRPVQSHTPQSHNPRCTADWRDASSSQRARVSQYWNTNAPILGDETVIIMQDARRKYRRYTAWILRASWSNPKDKNKERGKFVRLPLPSCYSVQHAVHFKLHVNLLVRQRCSGVRLRTKNMYKLEGRGIASRWGGFFLIYLILPAALGPWGRLSL